MAQQYSEISEKLQSFIQQQMIFFTATASKDGRVNVSPKGIDSLRVVNSKQVLWLNLTGSGNETSAHVQELPRMTLMFMALTGSPMILRLYGTARVFHQNDDQWHELYSRFNPVPGARQIFELNVDMVQTSCGMGVPLFDYAGEREQLTDWAIKKGDVGLEKYWREKNQQSIDGKATNIIARNIRD